MEISYSICLCSAHCALVIFPGVRSIQLILRSAPKSDSVDVSVCKLQEMVKNREAWHAAIHGVAKSQTRMTGSAATDQLHEVASSSSDSFLLQVIH